MSGLVANVGVPVEIGSQAQSVQLLFPFPVTAGLLISIIASDSDTIGDTFEVSVSAILFSAVSVSIIVDTFREYR